MVPVVSLVPHETTGYRLESLRDWGRRMNSWREFFGEGRLAVLMGVAAPETPTSGTGRACALIGDGLRSGDGNYF